MHTIDAFNLSAELARDRSNAEEAVVAALFSAPALVHYFAEKGIVADTFADEDYRAMFIAHELLPRPEQYAERRSLIVDALHWLKMWDDSHDFRRGPIWTARGLSHFQLMGAPKTRDELDAFAELAAAQLLHLTKVTTEATTLADRLNGLLRGTTEPVAAIAPSVTTNNTFTVRQVRRKGVA